MSGRSDIDCVLGCYIVHEDYNNLAWGWMGRGPPAAAPVAGAPSVFDAEVAVKQARSAYCVGCHGLLKKQGSKVEPLDRFVAESL